jgi:hypothetical protein
VTEPEDLYREFELEDDPLEDEMSEEDEDEDEEDEDEEDGGIEMSTKPRAEVANGNVTTAIFKAEEATREAIAAWELVERCEETIVELSEVSELEKGIASRGVGYARKNVDVLRALIGKRAYRD